MLGLAGHDAPVGAETAKSGANPALSRNCDATLEGMSQVDLLPRDERFGPRRKGRFGWHQP
jgi:hypothetical protein